MPDPGEVQQPLTDTPLVNVTGERITLGPISNDLVPAITRWMNDFSGMMTLGPRGPRPVMEESERRWVESLAASNDHLFVIRELATGRPIGTTDLSGIDYRNRSAMFGINIGEADARGRGYGTEATRLVLDYAFTVVGLHSVRLGVAAFNHAGQRAYEKAGFRECGRWRECWWFAGKLWGEILMDCVSSEFTSPVLGKIFQPAPARF